MTNKVLGVLVALLLIVLVPNFKSCFLCISSPVELRSLTTPLFAKHILRRDWKVKLWDNLFSRIYKKKLPNLLCNISPSNEVLPLNAINCSKKKICGYLRLLWRVLCDGTWLAIHQHISLLSKDRICISQLPLQLDMATGLLLANTE